MKKNIGKADQIIRIIIGIVLIALAIIKANVIFAVIALIPLTTAFLRWCPLYYPFKISTCRNRYEL